MGIPDHLTCLLRNLYELPVRKQQLELDMEQQIGSKLEKEYVKVCKLHLNKAVKTKQGLP